MEENSLLELGRPNGYILSLLELYKSADKFNQKDILEKIRKTISHNVFGSRLSDATFLELEKTLSGKVDGANYNGFKSKSQSMKPDIGKTHLLVVTDDDQRDGGCFSIKVSKESENNSSAELRNHVKVLESCLFESINLYCQPEEFFVRSTIRYCSPKIYSIDGNSCEQKIDGDSLQLPLAISMFSFITNLQIPSNIAMSGKIDGNQIISVTGIESKISALIKEYPEIDTIILPSSNEGAVDNIDGIKIHFVSSFDEAIKIVFPELIEGKKKLNLIERIHFEIENIEIVSASKMKGIILHCKDKPIGDRVTLDPSILKYVSHYINELLNKLDKEIQCIILSDKFTKWFTARIVLDFKNKRNIIAIYDPQSEPIVIESKNGEGFTLGSRIVYTKL